MSTLNSAEYTAYLERIHFPIAEGSPKPSLHLLQRLHEAHLLTVPFENLSIHYGEPIVLQADKLFHKIVSQRRGGFCYELNGLFARLLQHFGFEVTLLSAGVANDAGIFGPEFDHLTLLIHQLEGADWLADVGFGASFRLPLRFEADMEQVDVDGKKYRLQRENENQRTSWILQQLHENTWQSQYRFTLQSHELDDFTEMCHYQQTSPESHFTQKRICSLATPTGRITLSDLLLITTKEGQRSERMLASEEEYREVLKQRFEVVL